MNTTDVTLAPNAIRHLLEIKSRDPAKQVLRLIIDSGGCSGFKYHFELTSAAEAGDVIFSHEGATLAIDPLSLEFVKGAVVDYVEELIGSAFVITNPNASSSCGCGSSFSL